MLWGRGSVWGPAQGAGGWAGQTGTRALTWPFMIFVMSSGGFSGKGRARSKMLTQD